MVQPIPFMEVESAWARVAAMQAPDGMGEEAFFAAMRDTEMLDMSAAVQRADAAVGQL
jgi:hypothetical protein